MAMQRIRDHYFLQRGKVYSYQRGNYKRLRNDQVPADVAEAAAKMTSEPSPRVRDKRTLARGKAGKHALGIAARVPELEAHAPIAPPTLPEPPAPAPRAPLPPVRATPFTVLARRLLEELLTSDGDVRELVRDLIREELHNPDFRAEILDRLAGAEVERWSEPEPEPEPEPAQELAAPDDAEEGPGAPDANAGNVEPAPGGSEPLHTFPGPMGSFPGPMGDFNPPGKPPKVDRDTPTEPALPRPEAPESATPTGEN